MTGDAARVVGLSLELHERDACAPLERAAAGSGGGQLAGWGALDGGVLVGCWTVRNRAPQLLDASCYLLLLRCVTLRYGRARGEVGVEEIAPDVLAERAHQVAFEESISQPRQ